jgi:hypothetical protein
MAGSPRWKVYVRGKYVASCKYLEDAAAIVALNGDGTEIRDDHGPVLWREGQEDFPASESYDGVAKVVLERDAAGATPYHAAGPNTWRTRPRQTA